VTFRTGSGDDPTLCYHCHKEDENLHPLLVRASRPVFPWGSPRGWRGKSSARPAIFSTPPKPTTLS
jgi:hypothetical protein